MRNRNKTAQEQQQYVVKANDLIRKTRYNLTTQQQKIVLYAISKIKPDDSPDTTYEISIEKLCKTCGIDIQMKSGYYYQTIKNDLRTLAIRQWCVMPDGVEKTISWIGDAEITPLCGTVKITFNKHMTPFLFELHERYTQYRLENVLVFKGKYSIRLYEILRSYITQTDIDNEIEKKIVMSIDELKQCLDIDAGYQRWADFSKYVIKKAVDEINQCSDEMHITYTTERKGHTIDKITFTCATPTPIQKLNAHAERRKRL